MHRAWLGKLSVHGELRSGWRLENSAQLFAHLVVGDVACVGLVGGQELEKPRFFVLVLTDELVHNVRQFLKCVSLEIVDKVFHFFLSVFADGANMPARSAYVARTADRKSN